MMYFAVKDKEEHFLSRNYELDQYLADGYEIHRRDMQGNDTLIAANGEWLEEKPNIEHMESFTFTVPQEIADSLRQFGADLAYISMMTGVDL